MRKLATIQRITEINPIIGADSIEVASILGWKVVIQKNQFKVDDIVVYCEIDSLLPIRPEFEFLRKSCYKKNENGEGFRIKTIRLRGQISQGIVFPLTILNKSDQIIAAIKNGRHVEGTDITESIGITQYIPAIPQNIAGTVKGPFPSFILKTDETRVQVLQDVLTRHKGKVCYVTEKVDGSSVTYYYRNGEFGVCSRNLELKETEDNLLWKMARKYKIEEILKQTGKNMALQGELIGIGVQKNNLRIPENKVLFFNVFDIDKCQYYNYSEFIHFFANVELESVPILETNYILNDNIDFLIEKSKGVSKLNEKVFREGIVIRPLEECFDFHMSQGFANGRLSFKAINPEYLLKYSEE